MEMLAMGQYGWYVWSSFGLTFIVVIICVVQARRRHSSVFRAVAQRVELMERTE
ncbi:MAG: heme exporter protein CcmD [Woeseiaceae bacterium]|nr:heme exporter protein CcmD [Woeseiaceae bacterium]